MKKFSPFPCRTNDAILFVQSYRDGELSGQLIHPRGGELKEIRSIPQLILILDEILLQEDGLINYHTFDQTGYEKIRRIATIRIQILFREHYTWQGCVQWEEQRKEVTFRSVLELIQILDEILSE